MFLQVKNISKQFGSDEVVKQLSFTLEANKTMSILGQSGCGKTTMLKIIAGLLEANSGEIVLDKKEISQESSKSREAVYLYQEDLLFPHLTVFENIAFGLRLKKLAKAIVEEKVMAMIKSLELSGKENKFPDQLSGGQRQRVSFGRAIIINPKLLLLDEPFGSLDVSTRERMQLLFKKLASEFEITSLFVTHDLKEALLIGDEIGLMQTGILKVYADKTDFINDPKTGVKHEMAFWEEMVNQKSIKE